MYIQLVFPTVILISNIYIQVVFPTVIQNNSQGLFG